MEELQPGDRIPSLDVERTPPKYNPGDRLPDPVEPVSSFSSEGLSDALTQGGRGLARGVGDIAAIPALATQAAHWTSNAAKRAYDHYLEMTGKTQPGSADAAQAARTRATEAAQTPAERSGKVVDAFGYKLPTIQGMEDITNKTLELGTDPAKTNLGAFVGAGARAIPTALLTAGQGLGARIGMGVGAGMLGHAGEIISEDTGIPGLGMVGAVGGASAGARAATKVGSILRPGQAGVKALASATARDVASGRGNINALAPGNTSMTPGTIIADAASGPNATRIIGRAGGASPTTEAELQSINENIISKAPNINSNLGNFIGKNAGITSSAPVLRDAIEAETKANITNLYTTAQNKPAAQAMQSPALDRAMTGNTMKSVSKTVESHATDAGSQIKPPSVDAAGNIVGGNLHYYDAVGKVLRDKIATAAAAGEKAEVARLTNLRSNLLQTIDTAVPEYNAARAAAFDKFAQQGAVETGFKSLAESNPFDLHDIMKAYGKSLPEHQEMFKQGLGFALQDLAERQGPQAIQRIFASPQKANLIKSVLGPDATEAILGRTAADALIAKVRPIQARDAANSRTMDVARAGLGAKTAHDIFSGNVLGAASTGAAYMGTHAFDFITHFGNNRRAMAILKLAGSSDPKDMQMFYRMVTKDPAMQSTLKQMYGYASAGAFRGAVSEQNTPPSPITRATGGRVGSDHERLVGRLMTLAERAKKEVNTSTEPLLNVPDAAIVKALHVANQAI